MPPLAHLLAPQIMAKAREIEAELNPHGGLEIGPAEVTPLRKPGIEIGPAEVTPLKKKPGIELGPAEVTPLRQHGYLAQQNVGFEKTPYDPRGLVDKPAQKSFDSRTPGGAMLEGVGILQRSGDPIAQRVGRAFLGGMSGKVTGNEGTYRPPQAGQTVDAKGKEPSMSMTVPFPSTRQPIGYTERGEAIYDAPPAPARAPLKLKRGEAAGIDEKGESVDPRGRKLGYLSSPAAPNGTVAGKGRELPMRDGLRRQTDAPMDRRDAFGAGALKQLYEPHLKALQENFQDTGKEAFPQGYFNGMTPAKRKDIEEGVKALREMERGQPA